MKIEIFILNYNGKDLLEAYLPSIVEASNVSKYDTRVIVIDNCSTDNSLSFVSQDFPNVRIFKTDQNRVFCSYNQAVRLSKADIVILLNNDIIVDKDFIDPLMETFQNYKDAFLVGSKCLLIDKVTYDGTKSKCYIDKGMFKSSTRYDGYESDIDLPGYTMQAGFGAFDRKKFIELNGYDDLYLPGILEDADLCYRAWKSGYKGYYQPRSLIYHMSQASFKKEFGSKKIMELAHRNTFLFMWKNIDGLIILLKHIFWLPLRILYSIFLGKFEFLTGFLKALRKLPQAISKRRMKKEALLSDKEVFEISKTI